MAFINFTFVGYNNVSHFNGTTEEVSLLWNVTPGGENELKSSFLEAEVLAPDWNPIDWEPMLEMCRNRARLVTAVEDFARIERQNFDFFGWYLRISYEMNDSRRWASTSIVRNLADLPQEFWNLVNSLFQSGCFTALYICFNYVFSIGRTVILLALEISFVHAIDPISGASRVAQAIPARFEGFFRAGSRKRKRLEVSVTSLQSLENWPATNRVVSWQDAHPQALLLAVLFLTYYKKNQKTPSAKSHITRFKKAMREGGNSTLLEKHSQAAREELASLMNVAPSAQRVYGPTNLWKEMVESCQASPMELSETVATMVTEPFLILCYDEKEDYWYPFFTSLRSSPWTWSSSVARKVHWIVMVVSTDGVTYHYHPITKPNVFCEVLGYCPVCHPPSTPKNLKKVCAYHLRVKTYKKRKLNEMKKRFVQFSQEEDVRGDIICKINNDDNLCAARALAVCHEYQKFGSGMENNFAGVSKVERIQKQHALELISRTNLPTNEPVTFSDEGLGQFARVLQCHIAVFHFQQRYRLLWKSSSPAYLQAVYTGDLDEVKRLRRLANDRFSNSRHHEEYFPTLYLLASINRNNSRQIGHVDAVLNPKKVGVGLQ